MYSRRKVAWRIAEAESELGRSLDYHTAADVDAFEAHLVAAGRFTYDELGLPSGVQSLTADEVQWIENEQTLVMCDADYFLTRYGFVKDEENIIRRFEFRVPQRLLFDIICDLEDRDTSIEIQILKARQLGMSTLTELLIAHRIIFAQGINAVIGSSDQTKTALMANMLFLAYDMLPVWMRPKWTRRVESDRGMLVFGHTNSGVSFQHGAQASGIARGTTPTIYHLSEVAGFTNAEQQIEASLFRAVHASPLVFGVLESTGEGDKGWWPDTWRRSKAAWPYTRLCPLFLPWFCGREMYPKAAWMRLRPIPSDWRPNHDTRLHVAKAELYVRSHPLLSRHLGDRWRMPQDQQWYWEVEHEDAKARGTESTFLQEMAGDDEEALQRSSESVFGAPAIIEIESQRKRDYRIYGLSGQSIESAHEPDPADIDYTPGVERVPLRFDSRRGPVYRWELVPLRFETPLRETDTEDANGKLFVFHEPQPGVNYSIGIDTSEGKGQDSTVISVWALGYRGQPDIQVAEFASAYVNHVEAFAFGMVIGVYYSRHMASGATRWPMPYMSVEQVAAVGDTCQLQMIRMGYPVSCFHRMARYDAKPTKIAKTKRSSAKLGWYTWGWSRPILVTNFVHAAQNGWMQINSPWMIEEMKHFEVKLTAAGKERLEHEEGEHDDRIFSGAMAVFCPHDMDTLSDRSQKRSVESLRLPSVDLAPYSYAVPAAALRETTVLTLDDLRYTDGRGAIAGRRP